MSTETVAKPVQATILQAINAAIADAMPAAIVLLPTPPLPLITMNTRFTLLRNS